MATMKRFLVRRNSGDVYVWTEQLAKRGDLEEVWADGAKEALEKKAMPDPKRITLEELERMGKADLLIFAEVKLGLKLDASREKAKLQDDVKEALFTMPNEPTEPAVDGEKLDRPRARAV